MQYTDRHQGRNLHFAGKKTMKKTGAKRKHIDPMGWIGKRIPLADDQQRDINLASRISFQAMLSGRGTEQAWATVCCTLNIAIILAECGHCPAAVPTIKRAQEAMNRSRDRARQTGKWGFNGEGIRALQDALNMHEQQISRVTRCQITEALQEVHRRVEVGESF